ncbi:hypothetical protein J3W29_001501 [Salmonella enterica]|nr:hypothetical protein [Salmonella enterica]EFO6831845.1 hypothetical protein [Salmonella enterica subsp. enterica serovar Agbeni]EGE9171960.1 hypothetical protein [Salmonella enterica subsp. enterica serovar Nigeria]EEC5324869.1 hypothetical protein [Salmonella enterica]EEH4176569.1 hypothetical protein [Salmonella enterica]
MEHKNEVFPAPAGINRLSMLLIFLVLSVPRASGDKPSGKKSVFTAAPCSPRQRG